MKSEIIQHGKNKTILLTTENPGEKYFIEKNAILGNGKDFNVEFQFERKRGDFHTTETTYNHCIIISNKDSDNFDFVIDEAIEKEEIQEDSFALIDYLEATNFRLKVISITLLIIIFLIITFS
jgi:hypothetical protein